MFRVTIEADGLIQKLTAIETRLETIASEVWDTISDIIIESVHQNFEVGGRPDAWPPSKKLSGQTLVQSGALRDSVQKSAQGPDFVEIEAGAGLPYAKIHQFGGTINHPGSDKLQVFEVEGKKVFTRGTKPHQITIPVRRYFRIQDEDVEKIAEALGEYFMIQGERFTMEVT